MNSKLFSILKFVLLLTVAFGLLAFAFRGIRVEAILHEILQAKVSWVILSVLLSIISLISRAYRWNLLIDPLGYSPAIRKTTYALMVGYLANLAFPRLGEVTRCGSLSKTEAIPFSSLVGTVIVERVIDLISLFICLFLAAVIEYQRLGDFLTTNLLHPIINKWYVLLNSPFMIIILLTLLILICVAIFYIIKKSKRSDKESKFAKLIEELIDGFKSVANLKRPWLFIFHSVFIWVLYFFSTYTCFFALPSTADLGFGAALFLLVIGGLAMSAPVQGGIGVYHLLVSQGLMLYGLTQEDGLAFATLLHTLSLLLVVVCGIISLILLFSEGKRNMTNKP